MYKNVYIINNVSSTRQDIWNQVAQLPYSQTELVRNHSNKAVARLTSMHFVQRGSNSLKPLLAVVAKSLWGRGGGREGKATSEWPQFLPQFTCPYSCSKVIDPGPELLVMEMRSPERVVVRKVISMSVLSGNE